MAVHATAGIPADADALPDLEPFGGRSDRDHAADGLVAQDSRELREPPVVVEHGDVGVAQAAVLDLHLHLLGPEPPEFDLLPNQLTFDGSGDPCIDHCHRRTPKRVTDIREARRLSSVESRRRIAAAIAFWASSWLTRMGFSSG